MAITTVKPLQVQTDIMVVKHHPRQEAALEKRQEKLKNLICPTCGKSTFSNFNGLSQHYNRMHDDGPIGPDVRLENAKSCEHLYQNKQMSLAEIADECDTSLATVKKWFDRHDVDTKPKHGEQDSAKKLHDFNWLWEERWEKFNDEREIANKIDVTHPAVGYWLKKYNIGGRVHPFVEDGEILHDLYIRRDWSVDKICEEFDVDKSTVAKKCKAAGFQKDVHRENVWGLRWAVPYIKKQYNQNKMTTNEIADELGISIAPLLKIMDRFDIERREQSYYSGEDNKLYEGGVKAIYDGDWGEARNQARERDNHACQRCGVSESELDRQLHVHHKKPYKSFDDPHKANELSNLVSLCASCHPTVESWGVVVQHD